MFIVDAAEVREEGHTISSARMEIRKQIALLLHFDPSVISESLARLESSGTEERRSAPPV